MQACNSCRMCVYISKHVHRGCLRLQSCSGSTILCWVSPCCTWGGAPSGPVTLTALNRLSSLGSITNSTSSPSRKLLKPSASIVVCNKGHVGPTIATARRFVGTNYWLSCNVAVAACLKQTGRRRAARKLERVCLSAESPRVRSKAHLMHEQVLATTFRSYEAKAFGRIEPGYTNIVNRVIARIGCPPRQTERLLRSEQK